MANLGALFQSAAVGRNKELVVISLLIMISETSSEGRNTPWTQSDDSTLLKVNLVNRIFPSNKVTLSTSSMFSRNNYVTYSSHSERFTTYQPCHDKSCIVLLNNEGEIVLLNDEDESVSSNTYSSEKPVESISQFPAVTPTRANTVADNTIESVSALSGDISTYTENYHLHNTYPQDTVPAITNTMLVNSIERTPASIINIFRTNTMLVNSIESTPASIINIFRTNTMLVNSIESTPASIINIFRTNTMLVNSIESTPASIINIFRTNTMLVNSIESTSASIINIFRTNTMLVNSIESTPASIINIFRTNTMLVNSIESTPASVINIFRTNTMLVNSIESTSASVINIFSIRSQYNSDHLNFQAFSESVSQISNSHVTGASTILVQKVNSTLKPRDESSNNEEDYIINPTNTLNMPTIKEGNVSTYAGRPTSNGGNFTTSSAYSQFHETKAAISSTPIPTSASSTSIHNPLTVSESFSNTPNPQSSLAPSFTTASDINKTTYSNLAFNFSTFTYIKEDNSTNERPGLTDYSSSNNASLENMTLNASETPSEWDVTLLGNNKVTIQQISSLTVDESAYHYDFVVTSKVIADSSLNLASCCLPIELSQTSGVDKDWAVPVALCLSAMLFVTWIILIVVCLKLRLRILRSRRQEVTQERHTARAQARDRQWMSENPTPCPASGPSPRHEQDTLEKDSDQQRFNLNGNFNERNQDTDFKASYDIRPDISRINKDEVFELRNISQDREYKDSYERYKKRFTNQELRNDNDALRYDTSSFVASSPEASNSRSSTPQRAALSDYRKLESVHHANSHSTDSDNQRLVFSGEMHKREFNEKVNNIGGDKNTVQNARSTKPQLGVAYENMKENKAIELNNLKAVYSRKDYNHDYHSSEDDFDDDRNDVRGGRKRFVQIGTNDGDDGSMTIMDVNSTDKAYYGVETVKSTLGENRQGMSKCASFDDTRFRGTPEKLGVLNKKRSPTRKISTTSDTAMTYLTLPEQGYMTMASCYETVDNLAEVADPSVGSRFFIGSYSDGIHLLGERETAPIKQPNPFENDNIEFREHGENNNTENKIEENGRRNKNIKNDNPESKWSKPADDYVFPIVRKANMKILAERQQRQLMSKRSSESQDEDTSVTDAEVSPKRAGRKSQIDIRNELSDSSIRKSSLPSKSVPATTSPSRRVSYPLQIPKIILTVDNEVNVGSEIHPEVQRSTTTRPPRVRRIARANNPFLIETHPPLTKTEEKMRRSSAPSMPRNLESTGDIASKDRIIRSASGDHLCLNSRQEQFNRHGLQTARSWSSEFFDLIQNSRRETRSDDERLKKMIDDRYNALFNNKSPSLASMSRPQHKSYIQDLSPRKMKLISSYSNTPLPQETMRNSLNIEARFKHILEARISENPLDRYSNISAKSDKGRHLKRTNLGSRTENVSETGSSIDATLNERTEKAELNSKVAFPVLSKGKGSRPSLAQGTDGQDSDSEIQKEESGRRLSGSDDSVEYRTRTVKDDDLYRNVHNERTAPVVEVQCKSFEDDMNNERLSSNIPFSEKALTKDRGPYNPLSRILEQASQDRRKDDSKAITNEFSDHNLKRRPFSLSAKEVSTEEQDANVTDADPETLTRSSLPLPRVSPESLPNGCASVSNMQGATFPVMPDLSQSCFDDNFNTTIDTKHAHEENLQNKLEQKQAQNKPIVINKNDAKTTPTPPEKPIRVHKKRAFRNERFRRPPSPYLFEAKKETPVANNHTENSPSKNTLYSGSLKNINRINQDTTPEISSSRSNFEQMKISKSRSRSLEAPSYSELTRFRAITLETDRPTSHFAGFDDWSKLVSGNEPMFVTSANNTQLRHSNSEEVVDLNNSVTEPELELYFVATPSPIDAARKSKDQSRAKLLILEDDHDEGLQVSFI